MTRTHATGETAVVRSSVYKFSVASSDLCLLLLSFLPLARSSVQREGGSLGSRVLSPCSLCRAHSSAFCGEGWS